jgi:hypothetical protein
VVEWVTLLLLYGRPQVQILVQAPAILTEVFHGFLIPSRLMSGYYLKIIPLLLPSKSIPVHHSLITLLFDAI